MRAVSITILYRFNSVSLNQIKRISFQLFLSLHQRMTSSSVGILHEPVMQLSVHFTDATDNIRRRGLYDSSCSECNQHRHPTKYDVSLMQRRRRERNLASYERVAQACKNSTDYLPTAADNVLTQIVFVSPFPLMM